MGPRRRARRRRRGGARAGDAGLRRGPTDLRRGAGAFPGAGVVPGGTGDRPAPRAVRARALGVRAGPRRPDPAQRHRVHRGRSRRLPGPGGAVQRQPALPSHRAGRPPDRRRRSGGRVPPALRAAAGRGRGHDRPRADRRRRRLRRRARYRAAPATRPRWRRRWSTSRNRRPTTSAWSAPAGPPAGRRPCCGARRTSTSRRWRGSRAPPPSRSGRRPWPAPWGPGTPSRPSCTPRRSGRPTRACTVGARCWSTTTPGPSTPASSSR